MYDYDLLRNAIIFGSSKVIEYLTGPRPRAAYMYYATTHSDDISQYLKSIEDLEAVLPDLLGWHVDELNESPLLCAVVRSKLDILNSYSHSSRTSWRKHLTNGMGHHDFFFAITELIYGEERSSSASMRFWPQHIVAPAWKL
jgi:hypothetical protein